MSNELIALLDGVQVGRVQRDTHGRMSFGYADGWLTKQGAYPISLSMPLALRQHNHEKIDAYLWGLLPDNENILAKWGQRYHVSLRNAFGLIEKVGEDCAGAVQFIRPERLQDLEEQSGAVEWLSDSQIADRLRGLIADHSAWRRIGDFGQFSLAGAQAKTAFLREGERWGIPSGRIPTTHIFKPPIPDFDGHAENEHFCLELAGRLGFAVPISFVRNFEDQIAIIIERYDRVPNAGRVLRVHQEDICQALGIPPTRKYEADHGPGAKQIVHLLRANSTDPLEDVDTFILALGFNWLIAGTDGHAKNYSVLIGAGSVVRLAPMYDVASALPYSVFDPYNTKLAMRVGGEYRLRNIGNRQWRKLARELGANEGQLIDRLTLFAKRIPDEANDVGRQLQSQGLKHPIVIKMTDAIADRARKCLKVLALGSGLDDKSNSAETSPQTSPH